MKNLLLYQRLRVLKPVKITKHIFIFLLCIYLIPILVVRKLPPLPLPPRSVIIERLPPTPPKPRKIFCSYQISILQLTIIRGYHH